MNNRQKEVERYKLNNEGVLVKRLKRQYESVGNELDKNISSLKSQIKKLEVKLKTASEDESLLIKSQIYSKVYRQEFQGSLKSDIDNIVNNMNSDKNRNIRKYLNSCYETGYTGVMYDLSGQGIPIIRSIDKKAVERAVTLNPKISNKLYSGYVNQMKMKIQSELSRGIAQSLSYDEISRNLHNLTNQGLNNTMRIVRTEGHRIQQMSADDARYDAKDNGAEIVKQWDAALDKRTRSSHQIVDGEIRELDEAFSNGLKYPGDINGGASEVVNCRCTALQRAKWALDEDELETLKQRAKYYELDNTKNFSEFKDRYLKGGSEDKIILPKGVQDITKEYFKNATPNSHKVKDMQRYIHNGIEYKVDGRKVVIDYSSHERSIAELLESTLGGELYMVPRINYPQGIKTPDYLFRGIKFDLKDISANGKNTLFNSISKKKEQASNFILDISNSLIKRDDIQAQVGALYTSKYTNFVDEIILIKNNKILNIYKRKK